eukprot:scaffold111233_cov37-Tisochrysis_lutea.AAC.4
MRHRHRDGHSGHVGMGMGTDIRGDMSLSRRRVEGHKWQAGRTTEGRQIWGQRGAREPEERPLSTPQGFPS